MASDLFGEVPYDDAIRRGGSRPPESSAGLARHLGRVITHRMLLWEVWGPDDGDEIQYLRVYATHLRRKIDDDPSRPRLVTEPGVGYRLVDPTADG